MPCSGVPLPPFERPVRIPENVAVRFADPPSVSAGERRAVRLTFCAAEDVPGGTPLRILMQAGRHVKGNWRDLDAPGTGGTEAAFALFREDGRSIPATRAGGVFEFTAPEGGVRRGECIELHLNGSAPRLTFPNKMFLLVVPEPSPSFSAGTPRINMQQPYRIVGACLIHVIGGPLHHLRVYAPSQARVGESFTLFIRPEDEWDNVASERPGLLQCACGENPLTGWRRCDASDSACLRIENVVIAEAGVYRLLVTEAETGRSALSNPVVVEAPDASGAGEAAPEKGENPPIRWGMIHGHTEHSDGYGSVHHYFRYARDRAALDFAALADHDHVWETTDQMWLRSQEATAAYHDPPGFVTLLGYEWAKWRRNGDGDRCVYFRRDYRPMFRSDLGYCPTPPDLFQALASEEAIIIPHHTADVGNHCDWKDHDPVHERLVEIYSEWGSSECSVHDGNPYPVRPPGVPGLDRTGPDAGEVPAGFVQRALAMGWRVGFTAGGDDHSGHPGAEIRKGQGRWRYKCGILAVYAAENTRDAVWQALWNRRCYGTTGARIRVLVRVAGNLPGSELSITENPELAVARRIEVRVNGTARLDRIEIIRNNVVVHRIEPEDAWDASFDWTDDEPFEQAALPPARFCPHPFCFYYVRLFQTDGEAAWVSPVWIDP